jgi:hypothetical protein
MDVVPVKGKVMYRGKPVSGARVVLNRVAEATPLTDQEKAVFPYGTTGRDGTFQLTSYAPNDGAPAGRYNVSVIKQVDGRVSDDRVNVLPARYANPQSSGLTAIVKAPSTDLPDFEITD